MPIPRCPALGGPPQDAGKVNLGEINPAPQRDGKQRERCSARWKEQQPQEGNG